MAESYLGRDVEVRFDSQAAVGTLKPLVANLSGQSKSFTRSRASVEITTDKSRGWREIALKPGVRNVDFTFQGLMQSSSWKDLLDRWAADREMKVAIRNPTNPVYYEGGDCFIQDLETSGESGGAVAFSATLLFNGKMDRVFGDLKVLTEGSTGAEGRLYDLDPFTGAASVPGAELGDHYRFVAAAGVADGVLAATVHQIAGGVITGLISRVSKTGRSNEFNHTNFSVGENQPTAFCVDTENAGRFYITGNAHHYLIHISVDGSGARVGSQTNYGLSGGSNVMRAMVMHGGDLFAWSGTTHRLYRVGKFGQTGTLNPGQAVEVPVPNIRAAIGTANDFQGFAFDGINMYGISRQRLWRVDFANDTAERISVQNVVGMGAAIPSNMLAHIAFAPF